MLSGSIPRNSTAFLLTRFRGAARHDVLARFTTGGGPIAAEAGLRFAIREGGKTVGAGVVTAIIA